MLCKLQISRDTST